MTTSIEWTDETSSGVENFERTNPTQGLGGKTFEPNEVKLLDPRKRISILLPAVARLTGGDQVARTGFAAPSGRHHVIEGERCCTAVGAPFRQPLVAPPSRNPAEALPGAPAWVRGMSEPFVGPSVGLAPSPSDILCAQHRPAVPPPGQTSGSPSCWAGWRERPHLAPGPRARRRPAAYGVGAAARGRVSDARAR